MKKSRLIISLSIFLVLLLWGSLFAFAQNGNEFDLSWHVIAGGGGTSNGNIYTVTGTSGQAIVGYSSSENYVVGSGFWGTNSPIAIESDYFVFLPSIIR
jgi:hypothetical protein